MTGEHLHFLLAFLNSKLCKSYFSYIATTTGEGTVQWLKYKVETIPIPKLPIDEESPFVILVNQILSRRQEGLSSLEHEQTLDSMICALCDLNDEEIAFILSK